MTRSATEVMQDIVFAAVIDSIMALKASSNGLPNLMVRDLSAIHANTTLADLPKEMQSAIAQSVRAAFTQLLKQGYAVPIAPVTTERTSQPPRHRRPPARPGGGDPSKPRPNGGRPNHGPKPGGSKPGGSKPGGSKPGGG
jgi:hypothetical protein